MSTLNHHFIKGADGGCYWHCGHSKEDHPLVIDLPPTVRRPSRIDKVQGGRLPYFRREA